MFLLKDQVLRCSNISVVKVTELTELVHKALANERQERAKGGKFGFAESISLNKVIANQMTGDSVDMDTIEEQMATACLQGSDVEEDSLDNESLDSDTVQSPGVDATVKIMGGVGVIGIGETSSWEVDEEITELTAESATTKQGQGHRRLPQHPVAAFIKIAKPDLTKIGRETQDSKTTSILPMSRKKKKKEKC